MMRRMTQHDVQKKRVEQKAALKAQADSEYREEEIDPEEMERVRRWRSCSRCRPRKEVAMGWALTWYSVERHCTR